MALFWWDFCFHKDLYIHIRVAGGCIAQVRQWQFVSAHSWAMRAHFCNTRPRSHPPYTLLCTCAYHACQCRDWILQQGLQLREQPLQQKHVSQYGVSKSRFSPSISHRCSKKYGTAILSSVVKTDWTMKGFLLKIYTFFQSLQYGPKSFVDSYTVRRLVVDCQIAESRLAGPMRSIIIALLRNLRVEYANQFKYVAWNSVWSI